MALLNLAPTRSNLLALSRQLAFAEEGYDLLEQKRQILVLELMARLRELRGLRERRNAGLLDFYGALTEATLASGSAALDRATKAVRLRHEVTIVEQHLMGLRLPRATVASAEPEPQFGVLETTASTDACLRTVVALLPLLAEVAALESAVLRLATELRKTQRRCNALAKIFIPNHRDTIAYIRASLEERERESLVILKMIRKRLGRT